VANQIPNLFKIPELRRKILFTLGILVLLRVGAHITVPGVNREALTLAIGGQNNLFGLLDLFTGGALQRATVFALGIMPYISASIIFQLLTAVFPYFEKLQKEGEEGRKKITQYTRYATVGLSAVQAYGYSVFIENLSPDAVVFPGWRFKLLTILVLEPHHHVFDHRSVPSGLGSNLDALADGGYRDLHDLGVYRNNGRDSGGYSGDDDGGAENSDSDPTQGRRKKPDPSGSKDSLTVASELGRRHADHLRAVDHVLPTDGGDTSTELDAHSKVRGCVPVWISVVHRIVRGIDCFLHVFLHGDHLQSHRLG
jgi:hypothetical protein